MDSTTTRVPLASCGMTSGEGNFQCIGHRMSPEVHDELLAIEDHLNGPAEVSEFLSRILECDGFDNLGAVDFADFVSQHNWRDPFGMTLLAGWVTSIASERRRTVSVG